MTDYGMSAIEPLYRDLGQRIRAARRGHKARLSQEDVAERVGLPRSAISAIEGGRQRVLTHSLVRICEVLEITPNDILLQLNNESKNLNNVKSDSSLSTNTLRKVENLINSSKIRISDRQ